ncbi:MULTISPECIES: hypothetical protein [Planococcus]|uniref:hypothetical protein n=1 Tax=Planococcus TaxID=1372 RepID=UPI00115F36AB|nr:hypothetical protein [Planococcus soli]
MEIEWSIIKDYVPIIVVIISSVLAYVIGKSSERNKKFAAMSEESVTKFLAKMYSEVVTITNVKRYDIISIKNFIKSYANDTEIYKLYDDILINEIIVLSIKLNVTELSNQELSREFNKISNKIENIYWERYVVNAEGFNWFIATKTINPWISLPGSLFLKTRKITEYTSIILAMATYLVLIESFISKGKGLFSYDTTITIVGFFIAVLILYFLLNSISTIFDKNPKIKNKRNIKKYETLPDQLEDVDSA